MTVTRSPRRRILALLAAVVLLLGAGVVVLRAIPADPEEVVEEFFNAAMAGDFARAAEIAPPPEGASTALLTDEVGAQATDRISSYELEDVQVDGALATATVTVTVGGRSTTEELTLDRSDQFLGVATGWTLDYPYMEYEANWLEGLSAAGSDEVLAAGEPVLALPGVYELSTPLPNPVVVETPGLLRAEVGELPMESLPPERTLTPEAMQQVQTAAGSMLQGCEDDQGHRKVEETCPVSARLSGETWSIEEMPVVDVAFQDRHTLTLVEVEPGQARIVPDSGAGSTRTEPIHIGGTVRLSPEGIAEIVVEAS